MIWCTYEKINMYSQVEQKKHKACVICMHGESGWKNSVSVEDVYIYKACRSGTRYKVLTKTF